MKAKSENIVIICLICVLLAGIISAVILLCVGDDKRSKGVWWWSGIQNADEYLAFASQNKVTEIYLSVSEFDQDINAFVGKANDLGIDVYALTGSYEMIYDFSILGDWLAKWHIKKSWMQWSTHHWLDFCFEISFLSFMSLVGACGFGFGIVD